MIASRRPWARILWACFAVLFAVAGAVQFNDPDTGPWVALYWAAAVVAGVWPMRSRLPIRVGLGVLLLAFAVELVAVLWMLLLVREVLAVGTIDLGEEVQREFGGLLLVLGVMSLAVSSARKNVAALSVLWKARKAKG